jgi:2-amino-4-hydroxy-6-hydroxymethyldihydropteridine diphosphokinase
LRRHSDPATVVYLSLGSNLGRREANLAQAVALLSGFLDSVRVSAIYETEPMYVIDQPAFLNVALSGKTELTPQVLLERCQSIEAKMGRDRGRQVPKGPRLIDIDILLFGDLVLRTPELEIPHPGLSERRFVLIPLLELAPSLADPQTGLPYKRVLEALPEQGVYRLAPWNYTQGAEKP